MAPLNPRRRRKVAGGIVRGSCALLLLLLTAFALHHPVTIVLRRIAQLGKPSPGGAGISDAGIRDSRSLTGSLWRALPTCRVLWCMASESLSHSSIALLRLTEWASLLDAL